MVNLSVVDAILGERHKLLEGVVNGVGAAYRDRHSARVSLRRSGGEEAIAVEPSVPLLKYEGCWPKIAKMGKSINLPGCRIRVREQSGETIILVGIAVAIRYADFSFGA